MSDALSFAEIDAQHVELLPTRTTMQVGAVDPVGGTGSTDPNCQAPAYLSPGVIGPQSSSLCNSATGSVSSTGSGSTGIGGAV